MDYQKELNDLEMGISAMLKKILPQIQSKCSGTDYVLDDTNKEFEKFFLNTANHRLTDAYHSYVFAMRAEKEKNQLIQSQMIKTEEIIKIEDDSDESENENEIPEQSSETLVQSTTADWDKCKASDSNNNPEKNMINKLITTTTTVPAKQRLQLQTSFAGLKFQCNYCSISYDDMEGIYKHWIYKSKHADAYKAFQFHIEIIGACFNCNKSGTFNELKQHYKDNHPELHFGAVNISDKTKCLICCFGGTNMDEHFRIKHAMTMEMDSLSPIRVQANILDALKALRVQKKFKCNCCENVVYNTKNQIIEHYRNSMNHDIKRCPFIEFIDEQPTLAICGICQQSCNETEMLDHLRNHKVQCLNCVNFDGKINELESHYSQKHPSISMKEEKFKFGIAYLQTKLVYCNGLALAYANVLGADNDENKKIESFFTEKSSQFTQSILRSPPDELNNHDSANSDCNSSIVSFDDSALISPRSTGSKSDSNDFLREELLRQRSYLDTLVILGLPEAYINNDEYLLTMFASLCLHLQVPIVEKEIKSIYSSKNELIVKLATRDKKEKIIQSMASKYRWPHQLKSDRIVKIPPNEVTKTIYVNPKLTSHFHRMWMKAKRLSQQKKIYSYRLSTGGIAIQIIEGGKEVFAKSFEDIDKCVSETSQPVKRTKVDPSTTSNSKRLKSH